MRNWNPNVGTNFPRAGQGGWCGHGPHHQLLSSPFVSSLPLLSTWLVPENEDGGNVQMPLIWSSFENVKIQLCSSEPDTKVNWQLCSNFWINQEEVPTLFLLGEVQREYACLHILRRWGDGGSCEMPEKVPVDVCSLWNREKQKKPLPRFSPASPVSNTFALYQWILRTKCAQGKEIKIAKQFPFLSTELTEKKDKMLVGMIRESECSHSCHVVYC